MECRAELLYRACEDPSMMSGSLQAHLDNVGIRLLAELESIEWGGVPVRVREPSYEKADGVLRFTCSVRVMAEKTAAAAELQGALRAQVKVDG